MFFVFPYSSIFCQMRFFKRSIFILSLVAFIGISLGTHFFLLSRPVPDEIPFDPEDIFITSAYYYLTSKSLGDNAIAVVFVGNLDFLKRTQTLQFLGANSTNVLVKNTPLERITINRVCQLIPYFLTTQLVSNMERLHIQLGNHFYRIPFKTVSYEKKDVVTCIAPFFVVESWQKVILAIHIYRKYGSFLHVYIRSAAEPIFHLIQEYEKEGYLKLEAWPRVNYSTVPIYEFNPNLHIEFRNQVAAATDCLLQYKESASFIAFFDLDEILIPRLAGTYFEELSLLYNSDILKEFIKTPVDLNGMEQEPKQIIKGYFWQEKKKIGYLHYTRADMRMLSYNDQGNFSLDLLLSSIDFTNTGVTGKAVVKPALINHTWIHFPNSLLPNHVRFDIPAERNVLLHLKENNQDLASMGRIFSREPSYLKYYGGGTKPLLSRGDIDAIQGDFLRMKSRPKIAKIMKSLPQKPFYPPLMAECTRRTFSQYDAAKRYDLMKCPSPDRCRLPERAGVPCVNARAEYLSSPTGTVINVHHVKTSYFTVEDGCSP